MIYKLIANNKLKDKSILYDKRRKYEFELNISSLINKHKRKYQKKNDLRLLKQKLKPFELIQTDIKYLDDIPEFLPYYIKFKLPKYQITIRGV